MTQAIDGPAGRDLAARPTLGRRHLILGAGAALLGAAISPPGRDLLGRLPFVDGARAPFERTALTEHLGEVFRAVDTGTTMVLERIEALPVTVDEQLQFSVVFTARSGVELTADTHRFVSDTFGELPLFVTPRREAGRTIGYRAVVDRFVPAGAGAPPTQQRARSEAGDR